MFNIKIFALDSTVKRVQKVVGTDFTTVDGNIISYNEKFSILDVEAAIEQVSSNTKTQLIFMAISDEPNGTNYIAIRERKGGKMRVHKLVNGTKEMSLVAQYFNAM